MTGLTRLQLVGLAQALLSLLAQCALAASSYSAVNFPCDASCQTTQRAALLQLNAATEVSLNSYTTTGYDAQLPT